MFDIAIIGAGAAGMSAAITAAKTNPALNITVLERLDRVGKKISTTGNGQCNIANINLNKNHYYSENKSFVEAVFSRCKFENIIKFFEDIGVAVVKKEDGKFYPASLQAASVTDALRFECDTLGIVTDCGVTVKSINKQSDTFIIKCESKTVKAKKVIVATGGLAGGEKLGCDGTGFNILKSFGHSITKLYPAIVQLKTDNRICRQLKGIKVDCNASLAVDGNVIRQEYGEILFCDYGLSGPPILQLSALAKRGSKIVLDLLPDVTESDLTDIITARALRFNQRPLLEFFTGMLNKRLGQIILKESDLSLNDCSGIINQSTAKQISNRIKNLTFDVIDSLGHIKAQATVGGANVNEFSPATLESEKISGLFACGEVLDVCGDCGGYNLSFAWSSGIIAGASAAKQH